MVHSVRKIRHTYTQCLSSISRHRATLTGIKMPRNS
uniref:Uncharacterized protein n=1 Tax=Zea mays TaxID=4577 RepID=C4J2R8_MAIZE|nr:unknown [Zea mays]